MVKNVLEARQEMEGYITRRMEELSPNLSAVVGPLLAARLVALTGGMERLGRLPASTIQLLGAEKALFQFMKEGGRPPKHGVLFQHPLIHRAPPWQRGKMARALAASAMLAARADAYGGRDLAESIKAGLQKKVERIQKDFASPPGRRERGGQEAAQGGRDMVQGVGSRGQGGSERAHGEGTGDRGRASPGREHGGRERRGGRRRNR
jgi:nucleolar protein 56